MVAGPYDAGGEQVRIGVSVAHARSGDTIDELIGRADSAMDEAKKQLVDLR